MKEINLRAAVATRCAQIATNALKDEFRSSGRKLSEWRTTDHLRAITELSSDPTILAKATADVERWRKNRSANTARKKGSLNPMSMTGADNESCDLCQSVNDR